jgi:hypothetical protein
MSYKSWIALVIGLLILFFFLAALSEQNSRIENLEERVELLECSRWEGNYNGV